MKWRWVWLTPALTAALYVVASAPLFQAFDNRLMDWFSTTCRKPPLGSSVVLVGIDEPSFREIGLQWPWPRELHARLIDQLKAAGASVIALDVVFAEPSTPSGDEALASAVARAGPVVLAADEAVEETAYVSQRLMISPLEMFTAVGGLSGVAAVTLDSDGLMRKLPLRNDGFAWVALQAYNALHHLPPPAAPDEGGGPFLQFFGPSRTYPYVSYYQALDPDRFLPPGIFQGRLVIVGRSVKTDPDPDTRPADMFATPFIWRDGLLTAGMEIHATIIDNLRLGVFFYQPPLLVSVFLLAAVVLGAGLLLARWSPVKSGVQSLFLCGLIAAACFGGLRFGRIWISPRLPMVAVVLQYAISGILAYRREQAERRFIREAFSRYLSPALVDHLASNPSRLVLGGEVREMTVMFCDVRGFTTLSESFRDDPQGLTRLMNRFFTAMTAVILDHGGTLDKYIGDCLMAFWNAPVDDPDHASHACAAALGMVEALSRLNREWASDEREDHDRRLSLGIGIGVNTGLCVAGNLGSEQRFDYSVLGDAVNLASRLEGQSKTYGVEIVIGPETAAAADDLALLELDLIAVKGKSEAVRVFTVMGGKEVKTSPEFAALSEKHEQMLAAYRQRNWPKALLLAARCRELAPKLAKLYDLYEARVHEYESRPPEEGWRGVFAAKTK